MLLTLVAVAIQSTFGAASALPEPIDPERWILHTDYPRAALGAERVGATWFEITVDKSGKPVGCRTILSSGTPELDRQSCVSTMVRGTFKPARDQNGKSAFGVFRRRTMWSIPPREPRPPDMPADGSLTLKSLPGQAKAFTLLRLVEAADGTVESCAVEESSLNSSLDALACATASKTKFPNRATDARGMAVTSVRVRKIEYRVGGE